MWEKNSRPALASDPQAAINAQLADEYDIFIGIMGARFGTPTQRAESGTEEEFERARSRFEKNPDDVSVMFYFKDAPPSSLSKIDPKQLDRVQAFRKRVESIGLIRVFKSRDEFARLLRIHLTHEAQTWKGRLKKKDFRGEQFSLLPVAPAEAAPSTIEDVDEGYLDLIERGEEGFQNLARTMERVAGAMREITERTNERRIEIDQINLRAVETNAPLDLKAIKRATNQIATALEEFVARLNAEVPIYSKGFKEAIDPFTRAISMGRKAPRGTTCRWRYVQPKK